jgi:hypothetical protein
MDGRRKQFKEYKRVEDETILALENKYQSHLKRSIADNADNSLQLLVHLMNDLHLHWPKLQYYRHYHFRIHNRIFYALFDFLEEKDIIDFTCDELRTFDISIVSKQFETWWKANEDKYMHKQE